MVPTYFTDEALGPLTGFYGWLEDETPQFREFQLQWWRNPGPPIAPTLMDVIGGWVLIGDAVQWCDGSFELFLLTVIAISDIWSSGGMRDWVGPNGRMQSIDIYCADEGQKDPHRHFTLMHDALNRTLWEVRKAEQRRRLSWGIDIRQYGVQD